MDNNFFISQVRNIKRLMQTVTQFYEHWLRWLSMGFISAGCYLSFFYVPYVFHVLIIKYNSDLYFLFVCKYDRRLFEVWYMHDLCPIAI